jgi:uncharacterized membrane protein
MVPLALSTLSTLSTLPELPTVAAELASADEAGVVVKLDQRELHVSPGRKISFESTISNTGDAPLDGHVAHLNILTTDESVYVDPEDWSPKRTQYLDELAPGESTRLRWNVQAVTSGPLILFVSVTSPTADTVTSSSPLNLTVGGQRVVDAGGVGPLVMVMPAGVLVLLGAAVLRRRRHR